MGYFARCTFAAVVWCMLLMGQPRTCIAQQKIVTGAEHEASYRYDTPRVRLEGTLVERKVYGPPGYGEIPARDVRTTILVLKLLHPISVEPAASADASKTANLDPVKNVREVQLFVSQLRIADARKLVGKVAIATGTLKESITASQSTKVWLKVTALQPK